jgi:hypothetical protein
VSRRGCKTCEREGFSEERCCYCDAHLSTRHEHDHMPTPARHGGTEQFPVCVNCHDLKDRLGLTDWTHEAFCAAFGTLNVEGKILMARVIALEMDLKKKLAAAGSG